MADWEDCSAVEQDPARAGGAWVFRGTRVPVSALFENLKDGATVEQSLKWFPVVDGRAVEAVLAHEVRANDGELSSQWGLEQGTSTTISRVDHGQVPKSPLS